MRLTAEEKALKLKEGYKVWLSLTPIERYEKVMVNFTPKERKGVNGERRLMQYIIDNDIKKQNFKIKGKALK